MIGGPVDYEVKMQPKHKKNVEVGEKLVVYSSSVLIEQADASSFALGEEVFAFSS